MAEFQESLTVQAAPQRVFEFVSRVENLPSYLPTTRNVQHESQDKIRVEGQVHGHHYNDTGYFRAEQQNRRLEWGSDGEDQYSGWLQVEPDGTGNQSSKVTVHLSINPPRQMTQEMQKSGLNFEQQMRDGLHKALQSIQNEVEGKGGKVESPAAYDQNQGQQSSSM